MWPHLVNTLLGVWLMAAPALLRYGDPARDADRIVGPVIASLAIIAMAEVTRAVGRVNLALGAWLLLAPWILGYGGAATMNSVLVGGLVVVAQLFGLRDTAERFGGGWRVVWRGGGPPAPREERRS